MSKITWKSDLSSILLLLLLYVLQGIPLGLISSVPMILQNRGVSYVEQAKFSFAYWPFSLKLLWAPIVDSVYSKRMGRRKSWLVPMQYLIGIFMLVVSYQIEEMVQTASVNFLTGVFFILNFLAATQDIAVDGWALTILSRENVGYASTCNSIGQTAGYFLGYVVFLALESKDFCNNYLRSTALDTGMVTLDGFLYFWSWVFIVTTTLVLLLKREAREIDQVGSMKESYQSLFQILKLKSVQRLCLFLITCKIGFGAADSVSGLKLVEAGVAKDRLAMLAIPLIPLQILLPLFITKYTAGDRPMTLFINAYPIRLLFGFIFAGLVWITPSFQLPDKTFGSSYYALCLFIYALHQIAVYSMFVSIMGFFAKISDPSVGGTYMTLLNTLCNLGGNWPTTLALALVDPLTWKTCHGTKSENCETSMDGYYVLSVICVLIGFSWLVLIGRPFVKKHSANQQSQWTLSQSKLKQ